MHRIDSDGAVASIPTPEAVGDVVGYFSEGDPSIGQRATVVSADWLNWIQEELAKIVEASGFTLSKTDRTQVLKGILTPPKVTVTASTQTQADYESFIELDATSNNVNFTLQTIALVKSRRVTIVRKDSGSNTVTITAGSGNTIGGQAAITLDSQYSKIVIDHNGSTLWY